MMSPLFLIDWQPIKSLISRFTIQMSVCKNLVIYCAASETESLFSPNVSTTPIMAMGCLQYLPLIVVQLKGEARNPDFSCLLFVLFESWLKKQNLIFYTKLLNLQILIRSCLISVHHYGLIVNFLSGNCFGKMGELSKKKSSF